VPARAGGAGHQPPVPGRPGRSAGVGRGSPAGRGRPCRRQAGAGGRPGGGRRWRALRRPPRDRGRTPGRARDAARPSWPARAALRRPPELARAEEATALRGGPRPTAAAGRDRPGPWRRQRAPPGAARARGLPRGGTADAARTVRGRRGGGRRGRTSAALLGWRRAGGGRGLVGDRRAGGRHARPAVQPAPRRTPDADRRWAARAGSGPVLARHQRLPRRVRHRPAARPDRRQPRRSPTCRPARHGGRPWRGS
jgi:hypothetical protein